MKVLYLTALENTYNNDIHANQVLGLNGHGVDYTFLFVSPLFILNRKGFSINKNNFRAENTIEVKVPILSYHLCMHAIVIPYFLMVSLIPFICKVKSIKPDVVHCRNMCSTLLAVFARNFTKIRYKIVCDPRSVYVEECVITNTFRFNGLNYRIWKKLESILYKKSDACIGLSNYFKHYLSKNNPNSYFIPAVVSDKSVFSEAERDKVRRHLNISEKDIVFCYIGSIDLWHSADKLFYYFDKIKDSINQGYNFKIVFLSGNTKVCNDIIKRYGEHTIVKSGRVKPSEVLNYLLLSDFGMVPGSDNCDECYNLLYKTMISSKAEEYLVAGLPIFVNPNISSLAELVKENRAGVDSISDVMSALEYDRKQISQTFVRMFGVSRVVSQFKEVYEIILNIRQ